MGFRSWEIIRYLLQPLVAGIPMMIAVFGMSVILTNWNPMPRLGVLVILGAAVYILILYLADQILKWGLKDSVKAALQYNPIPFLKKNPQ